LLAFLGLESKVNHKEIYCKIKKGIIFVLSYSKTHTMKNWIRTAAMVSTLFISASLFAQTPGFHDVKVTEFEKLAKAGKGLILDVRTPKEYAEGHVNGSLNMNYFDKNFKNQVDKLDKAKPIYVYCHSGGRSSKAMNIMKSQGFTTIYNLTGGYAAWKNLRK